MGTGLGGTGVPAAALGRVWWGPSRGEGVGAPVLTVTPPHPVPGPAGCGGAQGRLAHKLLHDLFANYSSALRPAEDTDRALNVTLQVTLSQIIDMVSTGTRPAPHASVPITGTPLSPARPLAPCAWALLCRWVLLQPRG